MAAATSGARQASAAAPEARMDPGDVPHTLFKGQATGLGGSVEKGRAGCACIRIPLVYARHTPLVLIRIG